MNWKSWETWAHGLGSAFIGGSATAITVIIVDPLQFNIHAGLKNLLTAALVSGVVNAAFYLKKSPLPGDNNENKP